MARYSSDYGPAAYAIADWLILGLFVAAIATTLWLAWHPNALNHWRN